MEYRKMGKTGLKVSSFCLGTMTFGRQVDEKESIRIIQTAIDAGVNFIDTADMYVNGATEAIVSKAVKGKRDALVIASSPPSICWPGTSNTNCCRCAQMRGWGCVRSAPWQPVYSRANTIRTRTRWKARASAWPISAIDTISPTGVMPVLRRLIN